MQDFFFPIGRLLLALLLFLAPTIASSQTRAEIAESCVAAIEANDMSTATELSLQISEWRRLYIPKTRIAAEYCLNNTTSDFWKYSVEKGAFLSGEEARLESEAEAAKLARINEIELVKCEVYLLRDEIESLSENAQEILEAQSAELLNATVEACSRSYAKDPDETLLNPICSETFGKFGLPDTNFPSNFAAIIKAQQDLALAQIRLLLMQAPEPTLAETEQVNETQRCTELLAEE